MAIIDSYRSILTVFVEHEICEGDSDAAIKKLKEFYDECTKGREGLISVNYHLSADSKTIFNYSQWKTEEAYDEFLNDKNTKTALGNLKELKSKITKTKVVFTS